MRRLIPLVLLAALAPVSALADDGKVHRGIDDMPRAPHRPVDDLHGDDIIVLTPCPDGETITVKWGIGLPCLVDGDNQLNLVMPGKWQLRRAVLTCADVGGRLVWSVCRAVDF